MFAHILLLSLWTAAPGRGLPPPAEGDPFGWLEDGASAKTRKWTEEQNAATRQALDARPGRDVLRKRLEALSSVGTLRDVVVRGSRVFYLKRTGLENQPVLYVRDAPGAAPRVLIDPNSMSADGTTALDWWRPSHDGLLVAYGVSEKGSEESVLRVRDVDSVLDLPDRISRARHASVAWLPDRTGFYYTRYPAPGTVPKEEEPYHRRVYFHVLGEDPARDLPVYGAGRGKEDWPDVQVSRSGRWLLVSVSQGWSKTELYARDLTSESTSFFTITEGRQSLYEGKIDGDTLYLLTNEGAPRFKLVSVDLRRPRRDRWKTLIAEGPFTLTDFDVAGDRLAVGVLERASSRLRLHAKDGRALNEVPLAGLGTVKSFDGCSGCDDLFLMYESFFTPPTLYRYQLSKASMTVEDAVANPVDPADFRADQVTYPSLDGTPVTMFLVRPVRLRKDARAPTLLTGYGGFNISMTPSFSGPLLAWLERGGLYALPNLRGGGEYGELWHRSGMLAEKQKVFDDFLAAARWLIAEQYTSPERLAISGGSNGGLLVGAALTQAPELFAAAVCSVPLLDMLRYHLFLMARLWIPEYGSPEDPAQAKWLAAYSPYHRVVAGRRYPAVLFLSGESDTRVDPMHARKMTARLQQAAAPGRPILLRYETAAGHGAGKPLAKTLDEVVDRYSFLFWRLGMD
ncbi:MAG: prolyl oligopeptidase family serine peptidase [Elusimicrobiota bacterium]